MPNTVPYNMKYICFVNISPVWLNNNDNNKVSFRQALHILFGFQIATIMTICVLLHFLENKYKYKE